MVFDVGTLQAKLNLDSTQFNRGISAAQKKTSGFGSKLTSTFSKFKIPILAGAGALAAVGAASVDAATKVDEAYAKIRRGTGATGEQLESLKEQFHDVFGSVPASADEVSTAIADLNTRLGLTGDELEARAKQFINLANITGGDVGSQIEAVTRLFGDFSVATENQASVMDYLFKISQSTGASIDELATKTVQYGTSLRGMGFSLDESVALLGKFEKEGVNIETVLSSLKIGLGRMAKEGVTNASEALKLLIEKVKSAGSSTEATAIALDVFGSRAAADMAMAIREGRFEIDEFINSLNSSNETINKAAEESMTFNQKLDMFSARATEALLPLGNLIMDALMAVMDWWDSTGSKVFAPLFQSLGMIADGIGKLWEIWTGFWESDEGAETASTWWKENGPLIQKAADNVGKVISAVVEGLKILFEAVWPVIAKIVQNNLSVIMDVVAVFAALLAGDWEALGDRLADLSKSLMNLLISIIRAPLDIILNLWDATAGKIFGTTEELGASLRNSIGGIVLFFKDAFSGLVNFIRPVVDTFVGIFETARDIISNAFESLVNSIRAVINPLISALNVFVDGLNAIRIDVPDWVPFLGGKYFGFNISRIPHLADGGIVTEPTIALIGESGPEAVVPISSGIPGTGVTINVSELVVREEADIQRIARELYTLVDRRNRGRGIV